MRVGLFNERGWIAFFLEFLGQEGALFNEVLECAFAAMHSSVDWPNTI